jgi:hypothetical protein
VPALKEAPVDQTDMTPWMPRQEIAQIFDRTVQDEVAALPRREIPLIERVPRRRTSCPRSISRAAASAGIPNRPNR